MNTTNNEATKIEENQSPFSDQLSQFLNENMSTLNQPDKLDQIPSSAVELNQTSVQNEQSDKESKADRRHFSATKSSEIAIKDKRFSVEIKTGKISSSAELKTDKINDKSPELNEIDEASKETKDQATQVSYATVEGLPIVSENESNAPDKRLVILSLSSISASTEQSTRSYNSRMNNAKSNKFPSIYECMKLRNLITIMLFLGMISINLQRTNVFVLASEMTTLKIKSRLCSQSDKDRHGCQILAGNETKHSPLSGPYICTSREQCYIIDAFLIGYLISQIPTGIFARRIGFKLLIGIGMLLNTISGFLIPVLSLYGNAFVIILRFLQGMGEATFIPCAHWILTNWTPPNERGRRVAIVYSGIPIGIALALSSSFVVTRNEILGGWPSLFYYCSTIGILWLIGFSILVTDDPDDHNKISSRERHDIKAKLWGRRKPQEADIPWGSILKSAPFRAVLIGYIGYYYGFVVMVIEFPKFMHETMNYDINKHGYLAALPFGIMGIFAIMMGVMLDDLITQLQLSGSTARKIAQAIGQFGPAICIGAVAFSDCNLYIVLSLLTAGIGLNGSAYAGVITNLIDISPCFAGLTIAFTNFIAQGVAYTAIVIVDAILHINPSIFGWQVFFMSCSAVYVLCTIIFLIYASSKVQPWDRDFTIFSSSTYNPAQSL